jgi:heme-degrading monooxygenase HmoA
MGSGHDYVSGSWLVRAGEEDEFVARWTAFTQWSLDSAPGAESFLLMRDAADPRHFVSYGTWRDADSVRAWRGSPEFGRLLRRCRELCEGFAVGDYTFAAAPVAVHL